MTTHLTAQRRPGCSRRSTGAAAMAALTFTLLFSGCATAGPVQNLGDTPGITAQTTVPASTPPDAASAETDEPPHAGIVTSAELRAEAERIDAWLDEWYAGACGSVPVAMGDAACTQRATRGSTLAADTPARVHDLQAADASFQVLADPGATAAAAAAFYLSRHCDRAPSTDCIAPVDDLVDALTDYAAAVEALLGAS